MDNIAEGADQLIALGDRIERETNAHAQTLSIFVDEVFGETLTIVGNMHDPLVVTAQTYFRHAEELIDDWVSTMLQAKRKIKARGWALRRLGE